MSRPIRKVVAGMVIMTGRRTVRGEARMLCNPEVLETFQYILGTAVEKFGVILAHYAMTPAERTLVYEDVRANSPDFEAFFTRHLAGYLNTLQGQKENVFVPRSYDRMDAAEAGAVAMLVATALARPVALGLVRAPAEFGDYASSLARLGESIRLKRPNCKYFKDHSVWHDEVELKTEVPPYAASSLQDFRARTQELLDEAVAMLNAERAASGLLPVGLDVLAKLRPCEQVPSAGEPAPAHNGFMATNKEAHKAAVDSYVRFCEEYSIAWILWISGERGVLFPYGTWGVRVVQRAEMEAASGPPA